MTYGNTNIVGSQWHCPLLASSRGDRVADGPFLPVECVNVCVKSEIYHGDETDIDKMPLCANQYSVVDTFDPNVSVWQKTIYQYEFYVNI